MAVSAAASVYFGLARNINPFVAGLAGFVLESSFLWSYLMLIRAMKARDAFDVNLWRIATVAFGLFLAAVSVETISTLAQIDVSIVSALGQVSATLYVSAVGLSLILTIAAHVITSLVDIPMDKPESPARIVKPSLAHRAGMVAARPGMLADNSGAGKMQRAVRLRQSILSSGIERSKKVRLSRTVALNNCTSCVTMATFRRSESSRRSQTLTSLIFILPSLTSYNRKIKRPMVVFHSQCDRATPKRNPAGG